MVNQNSADVKDFPWDPLWEFVLGEEDDRSSVGGTPSRTTAPAETATSSSFLEYLFPATVESQQVPPEPSIQPHQAREKRAFWRRQRRTSETDEATFASEDQSFITADNEDGDMRRDSHYGRRRGRFQPFRLGLRDTDVIQAARRRKSRSDTDSHVAVSQDTNGSPGGWEARFDSRDANGTHSRQGGNGSREAPASQTSESQRPKEAPTIFSLGNVLAPWVGGTSSDDSSCDSSAQSSSLATEESFVTEDDTAVTETSAPTTTSKVTKQEQESTEIKLTFQPTPVWKKYSTPIEQAKDDDRKLKEIRESKPDTSAEATSYTDERDETVEDGASGGFDSFSTLRVEGIVPQRQSSFSAPFTPLIRRSSGRQVICKSFKNLPDELAEASATTGIPIHELSADEISELFPRLRSVTDKRESMASEIIGNSKSFEKSMPAHLQATLPQLGQPQSLFEYDYESGIHMYVCYDSFGHFPRSLVKAVRHEHSFDTLYPNVGSEDEVIIQVEASTVSSTDCYTRRGMWWGDDVVPLPNVPGVDVVGKVYRIHSAASKRFNLDKGDRVLSLMKWGGNSRFVSLSPSQLVKVPESIDPAIAVCLPETYLTAFQVLFEGIHKNMRYRQNSLKGKVFLVLDSTVSNTCRAISQIATMGGAKQVYASAKPKHFQLLTSLGVIPLSKDSLEWYDTLSGSIDAVISMEGYSTSKQMDLLSKTGRFVVVRNGDVSMESPQDPIHRRPMLACSRKRAHEKSKTVVYDVFRAWVDNSETCKTDLVHLVRALELGAIEPAVLDRIPLNKVARAQELLDTKKLSGFLVCEPWLVSKTRAVQV